MQCQLRVGLLTGVLIAPSSAMAQEATLHLGEARLVTRQPNGRVEQTKGDLPADRGFSFGFMTGAALCGVSAALLSHASGGGVDLAVFQAAAICGGIHGGIGAALGAAFPSHGYRQRRDVYVAPAEVR